jgi:hypothetical protein
LDGQSFTNKKSKEIHHRFNLPKIINQWALGLILNAIPLLKAYLWAKK